MSEITWTNMNENLMALLEAVLTLAASDAAASVPRRPSRPAIKAGGYSEDIFLDLSQEELEEFSCSICYQILKDTMQCMNQHKFCHSCVYVWSTTGQYANRIRCPVCRCHGYYLRSDDLDEKIGRKRVKCVLEGCQWKGPLKLLSSHRHTNYGSSQPPSTSRPAYSLQDNSDEEDDEEEDDAGRSSVLELPYLGQAPPRLPHRNMARFNGTGLRARSLVTTVGAAALAADSDSGNPTTHTTTTRLDGNTTSVNSPAGGSGGILLRDRRNAGTSTEPIPSGGSVLHRSTLRQRVPAIRRGVNRITVTHTDGNNNLAGTAAASATPSSSSSTIGDRGNEGPRRSLFSPDSAVPLSPRQPRPPSGPRPLSRPPSHRIRRNLPGLPGAPVAGPVPSLAAAAGEGPSQVSNASSTARVIRAPPTFSAESVAEERHQFVLGAFQDRLRESRNRLEGLMTNFSSELERSRQEMADFQVERERQRREQLTEVRELGRRLGQVATELRFLLTNRRIQPSDSSSSSDD